MYPSYLHELINFILIFFQVEINYKLNWAHGTNDCNIECTRSSFLSMWFGWNCDQTIWIVRRWTVQMWMEFIFTENAENVCDFHVVHSATGNDSRLWQYPLCTRYIQNGESQTKNYNFQMHAFSYRWFFRRHVPVSLILWDFAKFMTDLCNKFVDFL